MLNLEILLLLQNIWRRGQLHLVVSIQGCLIMLSPQRNSPCHYSIDVEIEERHQQLSEERGELPRATADISHADTERGDALFLSEDGYPLLPPDPPPTGCWRLLIRPWLSSQNTHDSSLINVYILAAAPCHHHYQFIFSLVSAAH